MLDFIEEATTVSNERYVFHLSSLEVRSLSGDHLSQQLLLQPVPGHGEVYESGLCLHLRLVVRVGQFGMENHSKRRVVLNLLVTHLDVSVKKEFH